MTKTHPALVDGLSAIDIGQVLLDVDPDAPAPEPVDVAAAARARPARSWSGRRWTSTCGGPRRCVETGRGRGRATSGRPPPAWAAWPAGCSARRRSAVLPAPHSPLNAPIGRQRRVAVARAELDDLKKIRKAHGGTVNDVLLTVVTGALREWLLSRGEPVVGRHLGAGAGAGLARRTTSGPGQPGLLATSWTCRWGSPTRGSGWPGSSYAMRGRRRRTASR